jgi:hypothetical protein
MAGGGEPGLAAPLLLLAEDELEPEEDLNAEEVEELTAEREHDADVGEPELRTDPRALPPGGTDHPRVPPRELVDPPKGGVAGESDPSLETTSQITELAPLLTEEDLQVALTADARALLAGPPTRDEPGSIDDDDHLQELLATDARALLSRSPTADGPAALTDGKLDELLTTDARALLSNGPRPDERAAVAASGDSRGEPLPGDHAPEVGRGATPAPEAPFDVPSPTAGSHRGEATGDQDPPPAVHPDETHLFLSEEDLFSALTEGPNSPSNGNGNGSGARGDAAALAARPASPVEEEAEGAGEEQGHQLAS